MLEHGVRTSLETLARMVAVNVKPSVESASPAAVTEFLTTVADTMQLQVAAVVSLDGAWFSVAGNSDLLPDRLDGTRAIGDDWTSAKNLVYRDRTGQLRKALVV